MPGLTAPSDYAEEPPRHPALRINSKEPFNAEPHRSALVSSYITPVDFFYKRNHGPIPKVDDISRYSVSISGLMNKHIQLSMDDIRMLPKYNVTATLQCAGNKRTAMSKVRKVRGVGWDVSALGNATWGGAKLSDVLELVGIHKLSSVTSLGGKHVEFVSVDRCKEEKGGPYKASIPLKQATDPDADVLLAYEMNGETINRDHGYPLRVVVPGVIGARSVKWLDSINIIKEECQGFFMQKDYKMFPPTVDWDNINWSTRRPQMDFPVQSAICTLEDVDVIKEGKARIAGYAVSGGGRGIERVDISVDGGKTWVEAHRYQKSNVPYVSDGAQSDKWAWVLFEATLDIPANAEIVAKAINESENAPRGQQCFKNVSALSMNHKFLGITAGGSMENYREELLRLHEVRVCPREPCHHRLIGFPGVPLLEDDAGLPLCRAGLTGHWQPDELHIRPRLDHQEVDLVPQPTEPPHNDVVGACGHLRRLEGAEPIQSAVTLKLDAETAELQWLNATVAELALHTFRRHLTDAAQQQCRFVGGAMRRDGGWKWVLWIRWG
ncbi:Sulfite oxidase [Triticum urartu]|uniref:Sulfite oxidase n=1 Tax=Triticum urartu TaxID=4572 RepID=M7YX87_TRIUA|nr:Sulfite oxidase [Triticum urartu]